MSGLRKAKKYDWRDSNLALFGSDIEKNVKKAAAGTEKAWEGAGEKPGLQIWRIVKFKVTDWPKEDYGKFFNGDSYIILNTYKDKESDELLHDVHFWIGEQSTQDEYGTAAYKTVELDTFLDDKPVQHREVGKFESGLFKSYFEDLVIMKGGCKCGRYKDQNLVFYGVSLLERWGSRKLFVTKSMDHLKLALWGYMGRGNTRTFKPVADSGFRRVGPKEYSPRLLKFNDMGRNKVMMTECTYCKESVTPDNVYVIDNGLNLFQVNGSQSDKDERMKAAQFVVKLKAERGNCKSEVLDDDFQKTAKLPSGDPSQDSEDPGDDDFTKTIFKLSDESGSLTFTDMGAFSKSVLSSDDVFVCDNGKNCLVYVGKKASIDERRKGMQYAHNYLLKTKHPLIPVTVLLEGQKSDVFDTMF